MNQYVVGVDVGGTTVKCGIFAINGVLIDNWEVPVWWNLSNLSKQTIRLTQECRIKIKKSEQS